MPAAPKQTGDLPTTVMVAGDDESAKHALIDAVTAGGLACLDVGSLSRAHGSRHSGFLQLALAVQNKLSWTGGFAITA